MPTEWMWILKTESALQLNYHYKKLQTLNYINFEVRSSTLNAEWIKFDFPVLFLSKPFHAKFFNFGYCAMQFDILRIEFALTALIMFWFPSKRNDKFSNNCWANIPRIVVLSIWLLCIILLNFHFEPTTNSCYTYTYYSGF